MAAATHHVDVKPDVDVDVLVIGAGISGISAAYHLQTVCPDHSFEILEGRDDLGGTWDLFRYPGVRSDSDMHTLGFGFKPWSGEKSIADGPSILAYLNETVDELGLRDKIRFGHHVETASWSSVTSTWTVGATRTDTGESVEITCNFLFMCSGYYSYKSGYTPDFAGRDDFDGTIVHPQEWPEDLDYSGRRVVIIGSGATAVTLVPAMADDAAHVTMLQRSPSYVANRPDPDPIGQRLRKLLPERTAHRLTRWKNIKLSGYFYEKTRTEPEKMRERLLTSVRNALGDDYTAEHFTPEYDPWDQRLCLIPNGDLFRAIKSGRASVVTGHIDRFVRDGVRLDTGETLPADIIVTATGLRLVTLGEMDFVVDGEPVDFSSTWIYKGFAYSDVPNLASVFGYINASWTLRADLVAATVCRILGHMRATGTTQCTPRLRPSDADMEPRPWIDDFSSGYMQRSMASMPRQGDRAPWLHTQRYAADLELLGAAPVDDGVMQFTVPASSPTPEAAAAG